MAYLKPIAILLNLIVHILLYQFFVSGLYLKSDHIPVTYKFLLFPKEDATIMIHNPLNSVIKLKLERAITSSYREILNGTVKAIIDENSYGSVDISSLSFLPLNEHQQSVYISAWHNFLQLQGFTHGTFSRKQIANGNSLIKLKLTDSKHSRAEVYRYETDGKKIFYVKPAAFSSGILMAIFVFIFLATSIVILIAIKTIKYGKDKSGRIGTLFKKLNNALKSKGH
jgi:hypothetical protein